MSKRDRERAEQEARPLQERIAHLRECTQAQLRRGTVQSLQERKAIQAARDLCDQLVLREAEAVKLRERIKALESELQAKADRVFALESTVVRPMKINAAFVEVARLVLAETTWKRIWDRSVERAAGQAVEREAV